MSKNKARGAWTKPVVRAVTRARRTRSGGFWIVFENPVYSS